MDSAPKRPWYRLHWVTWVVVIILVWTLFSRGSEAGFRGIDSSFYYRKENAYGWPAKHLTVVEWGTFLRPNNPPTVEHKWHVRELVFNAGFGFMLVLASVFAFELWMRTRKRTQLTLGSMLGLTAVAACLAGLASGSIDFWLPAVFIRSSWLISWYDLQRPVMWPLIFAMGCTIYSLGWLALALLRRAYRLVRP